MQSQSYVGGATLFGQCVHAVLAKNVEDEELLSRLHAAGFERAGVREIEPSLEDVFVTLTEEAAASNEEPAARPVAALVPAEMGS